MSVFQARLATREALLRYRTTNGRSLHSAELSRKRRFCFAPDDRDELIGAFLGIQLLGIGGANDLGMRELSQGPTCFPGQVQANSSKTVDTRSQQ